MKTFIITLEITLHKDILDPAGRTVENSLARLGLPAGNVRIGKLVTFNIKAENETAAHGTAQHMAERLLVNAVMEDYRVDVAEQTQV